MTDWNAVLDVFLGELQRSAVNTTGLTDVLMAILPAFFLALFVGFIYRIVQRNSAYSAAFVQSLVLFAPMVATLFLVIGNNLARAFGMMGALNLVRFRHAVKSPLDTVYLFWSLAIGVACGGHFYFAAILLTLGCAAMALLLQVFGWADYADTEGIVKFTLAANANESVASIEGYLKKHSRLCRKVNTLYESETGLTTHVYLVRPTKKEGISQLSQSIQSMNGVTCVLHLTGAQTPVLMS